MPVISSSYHGYWAEDIWSVNSAFGTEDDLIALSDALHSRGMVSPNIFSTGGFNVANKWSKVSHA